MNITASIQNSSAVIRLPARFDFGRADDFHAAVNDVVSHGAASEVVVDFSGTQYLDSAGLGMLLVLRDRARGNGKPVVLASARGAVRTVLDVAHFGKLFAFR
jgi:anti-anti-sigma factor